MKHETYTQWFAEVCRAYRSITGQPLQCDNALENELLAQYREDQPASIVADSLVCGGK